MDGILIIDKEKDMTSRDVVNILEKKFHTKKIGHTGTLDPLATGVLIACIGKCTKFVELLTSLDKEYVATIMLGIGTDTLDITGDVLKDENIFVTKEEIEKVLIKLTTTYMQEVPIYSAIKKDGMKLYEYARKGISVELPKKEVTIFSLDLISDVEYKDNKVIFKIRTKVSKGTYIRSLIRDIASELNTVGVMMDLRRISQGDFKIKDAYTLNDVKNDNYKFVAIDEVLSKYKSIVVTDDKEIFKIKNGAIIDNKYDDDIILFKTNNNYLALYKKYEKDSKKMKPWKML